MTQTVCKNTIVFWQDQENAIPEQAIAIEPYNDIIILSQGNDMIRVNYESLEEFIKILRRAKKERP